ncbi:hypothetical protein CI15_20295 [Paraburkholderia monticola]|uniref:Uncharacterized protein n=1 Tax=Paraburkholderia monticola TaxID=1399968 RepID=A0A149PKD4_9BURK|nr:hypothetical protein [Paraburkholderia monticola]KXU85507.1 hypothetical protein CI15_20295 [Paraburkholderia monticola]
MRTDAFSSLAVAVHDAAYRARPFYFDDEQQALLNRIRDAWGEDCVIQISNGRLKIFAEEGRFEFFSRVELFDAIAARTLKRSNR